MKQSFKYLLCLTFLVGIFSCSDDSSTATSDDEIEDMIDDETGEEMDEEEVTGPTSESTLWDGESIEFVKENGTDPTLEENQDRITDNVWITRNSEVTSGGSGVGPLYNAVEFDSTEEISFLEDPTLGVLWAVGDVSDALNLEYGTFWEIIKPKNDVDKSLVMYLIEDDVYLSFVLTSWEQGNEGGTGGFSYQRSTMPQ